MRFPIDLAPAQSNYTRVGWVNEPDGRGTLSILVSCLSSLFLSSWAVMHLNIPAKHSSKTRCLSTYLYWCIYGIFGPELVIWTAWRQLSSAWALRNQLREFGAAASQCTIAHGFYTLMGGFVIDIDSTSDPTRPPFTNGIQRLSVTPKGLLFLAKCGHLPEITEGEILDKSKMDEIGKLLACTQVTWMIVQVCSRLALQLPVTTLEVTAVSHVLCALVLYGLWWHKPRKVDEPTSISGEWVRPLAAFMLMCSKDSQKQMLPSFQLEGENSEIAGLKLYPLASHQGVDSHESNQVDLFKFVQKHQKATVLQPACATARYSRDMQVASISATQAIQTGGPMLLNDTEESTLSTKERWRLAHIAIRKYQHVRHLLRTPPDEHYRNYEIALANYPEMPEKCRLRFHAGKVQPTNTDWLECDTQHFVTTAVTNWPHDGLLRTTSGLWIGASLWIVSIAFSAMHIAAWNAPFPTEVEASLWRCTSLYVAFSGLLWAGLHVLASISARTWWTWYNIMSGDAFKWLKVTLSVVCGICGLAYLFARAYLILESFMSLRNLPVAAYVVPEWTLGVLHIS